MKFLEKAFIGEKTAQRRVNTFVTVKRPTKNTIGCTASRADILDHMWEVLIKADAGQHQSICTATAFNGV